MLAPKTQLEQKFEIGNLEKLLKDGASRSGTYSHYQIADWCLRMSNKFHDEDCDEAFDHALSIAASVECQWDLFLPNAYSTQELEKLDFDSVCLPHDWFTDWLALLHGGHQS